MYADKILVLIPHPDDEVLGCGGAIQRAVQQGCQVAGLYLTNGCIPFLHRWPWERWSRSYHNHAVKCRLNEAACVASMLGLSILHLEEQRAARELWSQLPQVLTKVLAAIATFQPNIIWAPAYEGGNPDHDGLNGLAALLPQICNVTVFEFTEYHYANQQINVAQFLRSFGAELDITLTNKELHLKRQAFAAYRSEKMTLMPFKKSTHEQFRPLTNYDYSQPPHSGVLLYKRFQWVPFCHPRIDSVHPGNVSSAIVSLHQNKCVL